MMEMRYADGRLVGTSFGIDPAEAIVRLPGFGLRLRAGQAITVRALRPAQPADRREAP